MIHSEPLILFRSTSAVYPQTDRSNINHHHYIGINRYARYHKAPQQTASRQSHPACKKREARMRRYSFLFHHSVQRGKQQQPYIHSSCDHPASKSSRLGQMEFSQHDSQIGRGLPPVNDIPTGILHVRKEYQSRSQWAMKKRTEFLWLCSFTQTIETHPYREIHSVLVWMVIQLNTHGSDFDCVPWMVVGSVSLDDGGHIPGTEG